MTERTKQTRQSSKENDEIEFSRLVGVFIDNRWLIFGITSLCVFFGIVYALLATPIYRSDALIQVEQSAGSNILSSLSDVLPTGQPESSAETQLLQSRLVIGKTIDDLDLTTRLEYDHFPVIGKG
ncbi:Wzz/FepE/Etk N-terminal domain-containing protein, partial [Klebsiella pneumoniae]